MDHLSILAKLLYSNEVCIFLMLQHVILARGGAQVNGLHIWVHVIRSHPLYRAMFGSC